MSEWVGEWVSKYLRDFVLYIKPKLNAINFDICFKFISKQQSKHENTTT